MELLKDILQIIVALVILNVWLVRSRSATPFRGGDAKSMREEFAAYGLSFGTMCAIGTLKVLCALALLAGVWIDGVAQWAAIGLGILMFGALVMHLKIRDPMVKSLPATALLVLCIVIALL